MAAFDYPLIAPYGSATAKEYSTAVGGPVAQAPSQFAGTLGQIYDSFNKGYGSYNQALGQLGNSYATNYAGMASGMAGIANALGNTWNNAQASNQAASAAEAARQAAVSNLGTAAMTSYGDVAGKGMQAWAANQSGYQNALSGMTGANQNAVSQLGAGRYNALASLGKSGAAMDVGRSVSAALPGLAGGATGGSGYGGGYGVAGDYGILNGLREDINNGAELAALDRGYDTGMRQLEADQRLARNMPRTMSQDAFNNLMFMNRMNLDASSGGMNQFYDFARDTYQGNRPGQEIPTGSLLDALVGGYSDSARRISGVQDDARSGWGQSLGTYDSATRGVSDLWADSIGGTGLFDSPEEQQAREYRMQDAARERQRVLFSSTPTIAWADRNKYGGYTTAPGGR